VKNRGLLLRWGKHVLAKRIALSDEFNEVTPTNWHRLAEDWQTKGRHFVVESECFVQVIRYQMFIRNASISQCKAAMGGCQGIFNHLFK
jgi:hypothetical protein